MGLKRRRQHHHRRQLCLSFAIVAALALLLFASFPSAVGLHPIKHLTGMRLDREPGFEVEKERHKLKWLEHGSGSNLGSVSDRVESTMSRLSGPGSWPPRCISKCERCRPCKPVHISIQPGLTMPLEYYPEAWRCKCGNNLFMP